MRVLSALLLALTGKPRVVQPQSSLRLAPECGRRALPPENLPTKKQGAIPALPSMVRGLP